MGVEIVTVKDSEDGLRLDRFLKERYPALGFAQLQKILRTGQVRVDGARVKPATRVEAGQSIRIPPLGEGGERAAAGGRKPVDTRDAEYIRSLVLFEDKDLMVLNKPFGLAVQGGSGTKRHIDGMLGALATPDGERPKLVHRLDRDTAGCLIVAKTRKAATELGKSFRSRSARKIYWALVPGVPNPKQGRISTYLAKDRSGEGLEKMRVARHGEGEASHAITYYAIVDHAANRASWLSLKPVTGRTHQLRAHLDHIGHAIIGDPKYGERRADLPEGVPDKLMLLARRLTLPHPRGGTIDVTAPLPPHFREAFNVFGFEVDADDPILDAPED